MFHKIRQSVLFGNLIFILSIPSQAMDLVEEGMEKPKVSKVKQFFTSCISCIEKEAPIIVEDAKYLVVQGEKVVPEVIQDGVEIVKIAEVIDGLFFQNQGEGLLLTIEKALSTASNELNIIISASHQIPNTNSHVTVDEPQKLKKVIAKTKKRKSVK